MDKYAELLLDINASSTISCPHHRIYNFASPLGDGLSAARHLLRWARQQGCADPSAFADDMVRLFECHADVHSDKGIDLDAVLQV